jgi:hypothetical protein
MYDRDWYAISSNITCIAALIFIALIVVGAR